MESTNRQRTLVSSLTECKTYGRTAQHIKRGPGRSTFIRTSRHVWLNASRVHHHNLPRLSMQTDPDAAWVPVGANLTHSTGFSCLGFLDLRLVSRISALGWSLEITNPSPLKCIQLVCSNTTIIVRNTWYFWEAQQISCDVDQSHWSSFSEVT